MYNGNMKPRGRMEKLKDKVSLKVVSTLFKAGRVLKGGKGIKNTPAAAEGTIYSFTMKTVDGKNKPLSDYKGRVLLLVNTASLCGLTPQYDGLEALYSRYKDKGLSILAFPANEFGAQEPGPDAQIKEFCRTRFSISFDLFSKIVVKGPGQHPLYEYLTRHSGHDGDITWNFEKFLVSRDGRVAERFDPETPPQSAQLAQKLEALLREAA